MRFRERLRSLVRRPLFWVAAVLVAIPLGALGWWLGSPLFIDRTVDEAFPMARTAIVPEGMTREDVEEEMSDAATLEAVENESMPQAEATALLSGMFRDADDFHRGSGTATVYRLEGDELVLRFDDLEVTNGPDLHVILTPHPDPQSREDVTAAGYIDLGELKGNIGNQNYPLPADIDTGEIRSVVIYCEPFHVIFSVAPLEAES